MSIFLKKIQRVNPQDKQGEKRFKSLTEPGLSWGENQVTPANPNEVQPRYYEAKFKELLGVIGVEV